MQVMGKPRPCSSPASPSLAEANSFGLCDLEPAAVDGLQQPVPDCLEPGSCSSKPGHFSTPNGWLGIWADVVTATPNHAPGLPSQRVLQHRHGMSETRRKTPPRCPQLCRGFSWEAFAFTCSEHSLVWRLAGPTGVLGAAPRPWGCRQALLQAARHRAERAAARSAGTKPQKGHCQNGGLFWENRLHKEGLFCCEMRPCLSSSPRWALPACSGCSLVGDAACSPLAAVPPSPPGIFTASDVLLQCSQWHSTSLKIHDGR